ncbi:MAG: urease subunit beta [Ruminococcus sp.]|nr:urease subunit beta [Ruminococcus sp.]
MIPGEFIAGSPEVTINAGYTVKTIKVKNTGDRPIQVGSHFHFFEANKFLSFDREEAYGFRLDIPSGTAVRFEPGDEKEVQLVEIAGSKRIKGLNSLTDAQVNSVTLKASLQKAELKNFI